MIILEILAVLSTIIAIVVASVDTRHKWFIGLIASGITSYAFYKYNLYFHSALFFITGIEMLLHVVNIVPDSMSEEKQAKIRTIIGAIALASVSAMCFIFSYLSIDYNIYDLLIIVTSLCGLYLLDRYPIAILPLFFILNILSCWLLLSMGAYVLMVVPLCYILINGFIMYNLLITEK